MHLNRLLFVSSYPPEQCDLAAFTRDCMDALDLIVGPVSSVAAIVRTHPVIHDDPRVIHVIDYRRSDAFTLAAGLVRTGPWDVVNVQYVPDLFPGEWSNRVLEFVSECGKPVVTTFHQINSRPAASPRRVVHELASRSKAVLVASLHDAELLREEYRVPSRNVHVVDAGANWGRQHLEIFEEVAATSEKRLDSRYLAAFVKPAARPPMGSESSAPALASERSFGSTREVKSKE